MNMTEISTFLTMKFSVTRLKIAKNKYLHLINHVSTWRKFIKKL